MKELLTGLVFCIIGSVSFSQIKISSFPIATGKAAGCYVPVVQGGVTKKVKTDSIAALFKTDTGLIKSIVKDSIEQVRKSFKVYTCTLSQTSTAAPTATIFENSTGGTIAWTRTGTGVYVGTITGTTFPSAKTFFPVTYQFQEWTGTDFISILFQRTGTTTVQITTSLGPNGAAAVSDGILTGTPFEVRIYN
jgi:hypothetical protein